MSNAAGARGVDRPGHNPDTHVDLHSGTLHAAGHLQGYTTMIAFQCMTCQQKINVPDTYRGRRVRCPKCSVAAMVPGAPHLQEGVDVKAPPEGKRQPAPPTKEPTEAPGKAGPTAVASSSAPASGWMEHLRASKGPVIVAGLITLFGVAWLGDAMGWLPGLGWLWAFGLLATGILTLVFGGLNKQTCVVGPFLIVCSVFSVLRQKDILSLRVEVPSLVIAFGVLLMLVALGGFNLPDIINDDR